MCSYYSYLFHFLIIMSPSLLRSRSTVSPPSKSPAHRVCLSGPKVDQGKEKSSNLKKCLIIGDSISIGYTKTVADALTGNCTVYHAPWDIGDGGALDTKHGLNCLQLLMSSSTLKPLTYDAVVFNFGLHDIDCDKMEDEFTSLVNYTINLKLLKDALLASGTNLAYALTTPVLDNCVSNELVVQYNNAAYGVMRQTPEIRVIDLYEVIVKRCGVPPSKNKTQGCPITNDSLVPHYTSNGYELLAGPVAKTFIDLLKVSGDDTSRDDPASSYQSDTSEMAKKIYCKSQDKHVVSACPFNSTCVPNDMSGSGFACCLLPDAVDCKDSSHCCPNGSKCSADCKKQKCSCLY